MGNIFSSYATTLLSLTFHKQQHLAPHCTSSDEYNLLHTIYQHAGHLPERLPLAGRVRRFCDFI
jgi:hypothetical protein